MASMNQVVLVGRVKSLPASVPSDGVPIAVFEIEVRSRDRSLVFPVRVYGASSKIAMGLRLGERVVVDGRLARSWKDQGDWKIVVWGRVRSLGMRGVVWLNRVWVSGRVLQARQVKGSVRMALSLFTRRRVQGTVKGELCVVVAEAVRGSWELQEITPGCAVAGEGMLTSWNQRLCLRLFELENLLPRQAPVVAKNPWRVKAT